MFEEIMREQIAVCTVGVLWPELPQTKSQEMDLWLHDLDNESNLLMLEGS